MILTSFLLICQQGNNHSSSSCDTAVKALSLNFSPLEKVSWHFHWILQDILHSRAHFESISKITTLSGSVLGDDDILGALKLYKMICDKRASYLNYLNIPAVWFYHFTTLLLVPRKFLPCRDHDGRLALVRCNQAVARQDWLNIGWIIH